MQLPSSFVALSLSLAGIAWLVFARSQHGRKQAGAMYWLSLPFFEMAGIHTWFSMANVDVDIRTIHARYGYIAISLSQAIILIILSILNWGKHGRS